MQNFPPNLGFWIPSVAALIALFISLFLQEHIETPVKSRLNDCFKSAWVQLTDRTIWFVGILCAIVLLVPFATRDTLTPIYMFKLGHKGILIALLSNLHLLFYALAVALCSAFFYPRLGLVKTAVIGSLLQAIAALGIPLTQNFVIIAAFQALAGFSFGMAFAVMMSLSVVNTTSEEQTARMGLFQTIYSTGMFWGPVLMGIMLKYFTMQAGYMLIAGLSSVAALLIAIAAKMVQQRTPRDMPGVGAEKRA
ncbi:MFS transporter [Klebsiella sp. NPDC088457]